MTKPSFGSDEWYHGFIAAAEVVLRSGPPVVLMDALVLDDDLFRGPTLP